MRANSRRKKNRRNAKKLFSTLMILCIILSAAILLRGKLTFYFDKVVAGEMIEENAPDTTDEDNTPDTTEEDNTLDITDQEKKFDNINTSGEDKDIINNNISKNQQDKSTSKSQSKQLIDNTDDILIVVNKKRYLASDYKPSDLIVPDVKFSFDGEHEKKYMRKEGADALEELFKQAIEEEIYLYALSGYRSYSTQERLFNNRASKVGEEEANKLSARPGESEHQTGLAMDITSKSVKFDLTEEFGNTTEGKWVRDNAHKFGFIIRYLKDKTDITGYNYEPWHIRYVGKDVAEKIYNEGITLEEYFNLE